LATHSARARQRAGACARACVCVRVRVRVCVGGVQRDPSACMQVQRVARKRRRLRSHLRSQHAPDAANRPSADMTSRPSSDTTCMAIISQ
jgi:hypothetical protein